MTRKAPTSVTPSPKRKGPGRPEATPGKPKRGGLPPSARASPRPNSQGHGPGNRASQGDRTKVQAREAGPLPWPSLYGAVTLGTTRTPPPDHPGRTVALRWPYRPAPVTR